jgi:hypothetical protein
VKTLLATFLLIATLHAQKPKGKESMVVFKWSYNYINIPVCSATNPTNCIHHFTLSEGTTAMVAVAATSAMDYTYILTPLPSPGSHTYNLVAVQVLTGTNDTVSSLPATLSLRCPNSHQCQ